MSNGKPAQIQMQIPSYLLPLLVRKTYDKPVLHSREHIGCSLSENHAWKDEKWIFHCRRNNVFFCTLTNQSSSIYHGYIAFTKRSITVKETNFKYTYQVVNQSGISELAKQRVDGRVQHLLLCRHILLAQAEPPVQRQSVAFRYEEWYAIWKNPFVYRNLLCFL